jgi:hypothetical protein
VGVACFAYAAAVVVGGFVCAWLDIRAARKAAEK